MLSAAEMENVADALLHDTLEGLCKPQTHAQGRGAGSASASATTAGATQPRGQVEVAASAHRGLAEEGREEGSANAEEKQSVWAQAGQRLMLQMAVAVFLLGTMWWREQLPYQRKAGEAASLAFESDTWHGDAAL